MNNEQDFTNVAVLQLDEKGAMRGLRSAEDNLAEAVNLVAALADVKVVFEQALTLSRIISATYIGKGRAEELIAEFEALEVEVVVVNCILSAIQQRNLENLWQCKVIDRTGVILEIFGERARTKAGKLQVELARLDYEASRLVRTWTHLERQRGGLGKTGGPGERQIELDRRMIRDRITAVKRELKTIEKQRDLHRKARERSGTPTVALVGYTNAGKSTLFNALLKRAAAESKDQLFATLDPLMRKLKLPSGRTIILADTVGFVSDLPHQLVESFHATLEEVAAADLLLHVWDATAVDAEAQREDVESVLLAIKADKVKSLDVPNKVDLMDEGAEVPEGAVSAYSGAGLDELLAKIDDVLSDGFKEVKLKVPAWDGKTLAWLHQNGQILGKRMVDDVWNVKVRLEVKDLGSVEGYISS